MRTCTHCKKPFLKDSELCGCEIRKAAVQPSLDDLTRKLAAMERLVIELTLTTMKTTGIFESDIFNRLLGDLEHS